MHLTDFTGRKRVWIEVGQPEDKALAKACSQADAVRVYAYGPQAELWWKGLMGKVARLDKLQVWRLPAEPAQALQALAERSMQLQATVLDQVLTLGSERGSVSLEAERWQ